jgi:hypothetical protein
MSVAGGGDEPKASDVAILILAALTFANWRGPCNPSIPIPPP